MRNGLAGETLSPIGLNHSPLTGNMKFLNGGNELSNSSIQFSSSAVNPPSTSNMVFASRLGSEVLRGVAILAPISWSRH